MLKISPAVQLSLGLIFLTVSLFFVAELLGLIPGFNDSKIYSRQKLAENIALQTIISIKRGNEYQLQELLEETSKQTPIVESIGIRRLDGRLLYYTDQHKDAWKGGEDDISTPTHISIPILIDGIKKSSLEIKFTELGEERSGLLGFPKFVWLIVFIASCGFISFWIYLKRVLKRLDPSSLVPTRVRNALNILEEGVVILDKKHTVILVNDSLVRKVGFAEDKLLGRKINELDWKSEYHYREKLLPWEVAQETLKRQLNTKLMINGQGGDQVLFNINAVPIVDDDGSSQGTMVSFDDITEAERNRKKLKKALKSLVDNKRVIEDKNAELNTMAFYDSLTSCLNRRSLFNKLNDYFHKERTAADDYCVIMMDIDHFKRVNDTYGHSAGDEVIKHVAESAIEAVGEEGFVARFGGEEFCIVLPNTALPRAEALAELVRKTIESSPAGSVKVTSSFGVTSIKFNASEPKEIIHQADVALYKSKTSGRNRCTTWSAEIDGQIDKESVSR